MNYETEFWIRLPGDSNGNYLVFEGEGFSGDYRPRGYPSLAIISPRTGETWAKVVISHDQIYHDFSRAEASDCCFLPERFVDLAPRKVLQTQLALLGHKLGLISEEERDALCSILPTYG